MSLANTTPSETPVYECTYCEGPRTPADTIAGSYCSHECHNRDRGSNLLQYLKNDHRFCYTCFRQIKEVEKPQASAPDCVIGFQYQTEHGEWGQVAHQVDDYTELVRTGTICRCGQTDHAAREDVIQHQDFRTVVGNLYYALESLRREGQHDKRLDVTMLADALRDQRTTEGWDFALAVGHAIHD